MEWKWTRASNKLCRSTADSSLGARRSGVGTAALASLLGKDGFAADVVTAPTAPGSIPSGGGVAGFPNLAPKAKRVIYLMQSGGPPHIDMFDYKPHLADFAGKELPKSVQMGQRLSTMTQGQKQIVLPGIAGFKQYGNSGMTVCDYLPHTGSIVDDCTFIKSMFTTQVNHAPAVTFFFTGSEMPGRPAMGAWLSYGLGSANENLPGFVVMTSRDKENTCGQLFFDHYFSSDFCRRNIRASACDRAATPFCT